MIGPYKVDKKKDNHVLVSIISKIGKVLGSCTYRVLCMVCEYLGDYDIR